MSVRVCEREREREYIYVCVSIVMKLLPLDYCL